MGVLFLDSPSLPLSDAKLKASSIRLGDGYDNLI